MDTNICSLMIAKGASLSVAPHREPGDPAWDDQSMRAASLSLAVAAATIALAGCGGGGSDTTISGESGTSEAIPGNADPASVGVIRGWVDSLRQGDVEGAASYFAIPSVAENGPILTRITNHAGAVAFNRSLPCGARLTRAESAGKFTTATFRLTERPGPGRCGSGTGGKAETSFVIRDGKIVQWRRVGATPEPAPGQAV
jgi:hypothetical protein